MTFELSDVQGNVVRGYGLSFACARHFAVAIGDAGAARRFLGELVDGDTYDGVNVTSGVEWPGGHKPASCLNVGITWLGLRALGVAPAVLAAFPPAFCQGPAVRAQPAKPPVAGDVGLGDVGESAPEHWEVGGPNTPEVHLLVSLHARGTARLDGVTVGVRQALADHALTELWHRDARGLPSRGRPSGRVHFGYVDGIAQPRIAGAPGREQPPDLQPQMPSGDLLLGGDHRNSFGGNFAGSLPSALADNATYGAFRVLRQNAGAFEGLLREWATASGADPELIAAKLMGRWRTGVPLVLSPQTDRPEPPVPHDKLNEFDYVSPAARPALYDDSEAQRCPYGAHVRRLNPRGAPVMGTPHSRRLVRRSMPYGPEIPDGVTADDGVDRGLVGYFLCGDLEAQFEFLQRVWVNNDFAAAGLRGTRDPIMGSQPAGGGTFTAHLNGSRRPTTLRGLPTLVTTRGSAYCLLPGIGGLRYLASLPEPKAVDG
jgi:deferrochelatase/peroxidase EfeB